MEFCVDDEWNPRAEVSSDILVPAESGIIDTAQLIKGDSKMAVELGRHAEPEAWNIGLAGKATGEGYSVEPADTRRPFRSLLDVDLIKTTPGNCVFGPLKGALNGGLDIPHSDKRFAGFNKDGKQRDAEIHRKYIYGGHVAGYMKGKKNIKEE